eukprot:SAG22_NODE_3817_length_1517_cov_2.071932_1_plen_236_part_00
MRWVTARDDDLVTPTGTEGHSGLMDDFWAGAENENTDAGSPTTWVDNWDVSQEDSGGDLPSICYRPGFDLEQHSVPDGPDADTAGRQPPSVRTPIPVAKHRPRAPRAPKATPPRKPRFRTEAVAPPQRPSAIPPMTPAIVPSPPKQKQEAAAKAAELPNCSHRGGFAMAAAADPKCAHQGHGPADDRHEPGPENCPESPSLPAEHAHQFDRAQLLAMQQHGRRQQPMPVPPPMKQ